MEAQTKQANKTVRRLQKGYSAENDRLLALTAKLTARILQTPSANDANAELLPVGASRGQYVVRTAAVLMQTLRDAMLTTATAAGPPTDAQRPPGWVVLSTTPTLPLTIAPSTLLSNFNPTAFIDHVRDMPTSDDTAASSQRPEVAIPARLTNNPYYGLPYLGQETDAPQIVQRAAFQLNPGTVHVGRLRGVRVIHEIYAKILAEKKPPADELPLLLPPQPPPVRAMAGGAALRTQALTPSELAEQQQQQQQSAPNLNVIAAIAQALQEETTRRFSSETVDEYGRVRIDPADGKYSAEYGPAADPVTVFWTAYGPEMLAEVRSVALWAQKEERDWAAWRLMWDRGCLSTELLQLPTSVWSSIRKLDDMATAATCVAITVFRTPPTVVEL